MKKNTPIQPRRFRRSRVLNVLIGAAVCTLVIAIIVAIRSLPEVSAPNETPRDDIASAAALAPATATATTPPSAQRKGACMSPGAVLTEDYTFVYMVADGEPRAYIGKDPVHPDAAPDWVSGTGLWEEPVNRVYRWSVSGEVGIPDSGAMAIVAYTTASGKCKSKPLLAKVGKTGKDFGGKWIPDTQFTFELPKGASMDWALIQGSEV